jgi:hypothetical protein
MSDSTMNNVRSSCTVIGCDGEALVGGIAGYGDGLTEEIHYAVMTGSVSGSGILGIIDGNLDGSSMGLNPSSFTEIYADKEVSPTQSLNNVGEILTTADMTTDALATFSAFDTDIWLIAAGVYPKLRSEPDA